jgi:uncharacterized small protein (DUF1192 family)
MNIYREIEQLQESLAKGQSAAPPNVIATLHSIKEQQSMIEDLQKEIEWLKADTATLKGRPF